MTERTKEGGDASLALRVKSDLVLSGPRRINHFRTPSLVVSLHIDTLYRRDTRDTRGRIGLHTAWRERESRTDAERVCDFGRRESRVARILPLLSPSSPSLTRSSRSPLVTTSLSTISWAHTSRRSPRTRLKPFWSSTAKFRSRNLSQFRLCRWQPTTTSLALKKRSS